MLLITNRSKTVINPPVKMLETTGSMEEGGYFLTCADASDFEIGDGVIVEIGGEAGAGAINTVGVGGYHEPIYVGVNEHNWYWLQGTPLALVALIVGKEGNVLELDTAATVATTNANVYYDNYIPWLDEYGDFYFHNELFSNKTIQFPAGRLAFSRRPEFGYPRNCTILGAGMGRTRAYSPSVPETRIYTPKGSRTIGLWINTYAHDGAGNRWAHFTVEQQWLSYGGFIFSNRNPEGWGSGIELNNMNAPTAHDMRLINHGVSGNGFHDCTNARAFRLHTYRDEPHETYMQWGVVDVRGNGNSFWDCRSDCPTGLMPAFENFQSSNSTFTRCGGINAIYSAGGAAGFLWDECWSTVTEGAGVPSQRNWANQSIMFIGNNVGSPLDMSVGGEIRNPVIIQQGYITPANELLRSIDFYPASKGPLDYQNLRVIGTYADSGYTKGYIEAPDHVLGGDGAGARINDGGADNTRIEGIRLVGAAGQYGNISASGAGSVVEDCVADVITGTPTEINNRTNAEYLG